MTAKKRGEMTPEELERARARDRERYLLNREKILERSREYYMRERERRLEQQREYYCSLPPDRHAGRVRDYRHSDMERARARQRKYRAANRDKINEQSRRWRKAHPEKVREYQRRWKQENHEHVLEYKRAYWRANRRRLSRMLEGYMLSAMERIYAACPERVAEYLERWPYERYGEAQTARALRRAHVFPGHALHDDCVDACMLAYMYSVYRCAYMGYEHTEQYILKLLRIAVANALIAGDETAAICEANGFTRFELDREGASRLV